MKKINYSVPFFANTADDTHCFQAALKMILKYYQPTKEYSWSELEKNTAKAKGLWTWPMAGLLWLKRSNFEVRSIEPFDYHKFIKNKGNYLIDFLVKKLENPKLRTVK